MGATVKALSVSIPTEMVVFFRNLIGVSLILPFLLRQGIHNVKTNVIHLHLVRASAGIGAMYCFFYVIANMPLAEAMVLKLTAPIFIPLVALFWLKERAPLLTIIAVPVGMAGVIIILHPEGDLQLTALIGLLGGALAALAKVSVRRLSKSHEPTTRIVFYFALFGVLISTTPLLWSWQTPALQDWLLVIALGSFGTIGQIFLTKGYALAPSARVSPFTYFSVVFSAVFGYLFWGETLTWIFIFGAVLIALSGLMAIRGKADY